MLYLPKKGMAFNNFGLLDDFVDQSDSTDQIEITKSQKSMPDLNASEPHFDEPEPDLC